MTPSASVTPLPATTPRTLTVAVIGGGAPTPELLEHTLTAMSVEDEVAWQVVQDADRPDVVVCRDRDTIAAAAQRHPRPASIALIPWRDDGSAVVHALEAGADACVRGADAALIAAYIHAVARRRGLLTGRVETAAR